MAAVPGTIQTRLPGTGLQCAHRPRDRDAFAPLCERFGNEPGREHRSTQVHHPWTNGQGDRMNRPLQEAPVKQEYDLTPHHVNEPWRAFLMADHFATRLNVLRGLTPDEDSCQGWPKEPTRLTSDPCHHTLRLNT
jgi:hypothetical protein